MILSYDVYSQTIEEKRNNDKVIRDLHENHKRDMNLLREDMEKRFQQIMLKVNFENLRNGE